MEHHPADELDVEVTHVERAPAGLAHHRERFGEHGFERFTLADPGAQRVGPRANLLVGQCGHRRLERVDALDGLPHPAQLPVVASADDLVEESLDHLCAWPRFNEFATSDACLQPENITDSRSEGVEMAGFARRTRVRARRRDPSRYRRAPWPRSTQRIQSDPRPQPGIGDIFGLTCVRSLLDQSCGVTFRTLASLEDDSLRRRRRRVCAGSPGEARGRAQALRRVTQRLPRPARSGKPPSRRD